MPGFIRWFHIVIAGFVIFMKQVYAHFKEWEDFKSGMFQMNNVSDKDIKLIAAINLLKNQKEFYDSCKSLLEKWPVASAVNMTNISQNRRAWLGAAACCFSCNAPEFITRIAWSVLNKEDQDKANAVADKIINEFENENYGKTLFDN